MPQEGFNLYITKILNEVKKNEKLMRLIYDSENNALSPLKPNLTQFQKDGLIYDKIHPYRFIPDISDTACSYLNLGFNNFKDFSNSNCYFSGRITFYFVSHKKIWVMNGGLRPVFMLEEIKNIADKLKDIGMTLKLVNSDEYWYNNDFGGYFASYEIIDLKKVKLDGD